MAKGILGLEISLAEIRYVYLKRKQRGFTLFKNARLSPSDFASLKEPENLTRFIQELLKQEKLSPAKICLVLSGDDFVIHQTSSPRMSDNELKEVIQGEIEGIPKFLNIKDFDYIYSSSKLDQQRLRVLFCALARDTLNSYTQAIQRTGIPLASLEIAPLNLLELLYVQVRRNQAQALLVLDERSSYMMIFSQNECKIFFQMATGRADLYSNDLQLDKSRFLSWTEEMKRIFKSHEREFGAQEIEKIWFVWDNQSEKELNKLVAEELEIETISPRLQDFGGNNKAGELNPIFFLSLASPVVYIKGLKQKLNFKHFLGAIKLKKTIRRVSILVLLYMMGMGLVSRTLIYGFVSSKNNILMNQKDISQRTAYLEKQNAALKKERDAYLDTKDRLLRQAAFVRLLNRISWSEIFAKISTVLPQDISISLFDFSETGEVKIEGSTYTIDLVAQMIRKINAVSFLENAQFNFLKEKESEGKRTVEFGIVTRLKADSDGRQ